MLEALKDNYDVTLFTFSDIDLDKLNLKYGTHLSKQTIKIKSILPQFLTAPSNFLNSNTKHFKQFSLHSVLRLIKAKQDDYDLLISGYNAVDLGKPGIQYIHWTGVVEKNKLAKKYYNKLSDFSVERLKKNVSLVNSKTVAQQAQNFYNVEPIIVYPPVVIESIDIPWEDKENAFICSGRLVKAKQPHQAISIIKAVRERGFDVKLYLTGGGGGGEQDYLRFLNKMIEDNSDWVKLYRNLSYEDYSKILYSCKYGIHRKQEPFGISVAEIVKAGAIPFVKSTGGQVEIVGEKNQDLLFNTDEDAVEAIVKVLSNEEKQSHLRQALQKQKVLFSTERFSQEFKEIVKNYLEKK
ncbi:glycosyltransferase [Chroococcus sp. FPU101]|uniref:glycosyltransferase n=1 Tax=Chroococcus sp. FPU101 TaxID=1974212 RepID=UPI001F5C6F13|nr:glycosyltransferase [Chroococcus sp. FPU101]